MHFCKIQNSIAQHGIATGTIAHREHRGPKINSAALYSYALRALHRSYKTGNYATKFKHFR